MYRNILITGASGKLGAAVAKRLHGLCHIFTLVRDKGGARQNAPYIKPGNCYDTNDLISGKIPLDKTDIIIHCAFARTQDLNDLSQSIDFTSEIFRRAVAAKVPGIINISSQSIYGKYRERPSKEADAVAPLDTYALSKYSCEKLASFCSTEETTITSVRLASVIGPQFPERIVNKMLDKAVNEHNIDIVGGEPLFSFLNINDAADGVCAMLKVPVSDWKAVYNLGTSERYTITELAETIQAFLHERQVEVTISCINQEVRQKIQLDTSLFEADFHWKAKYKLADSISEIYHDKYGS